MNKGIINTFVITHSTQAYQTLQTVNVDQCYIQICTQHGVKIV